MTAPLVSKLIQVSESYPIFWIIPNDHKSVKNWRNKKNEGDGVSRTVRSIQKYNKREHWTKTLSVRFFTRIFARPVRSPLIIFAICKSLAPKSKNAQNRRFTARINGNLGHAIRVGFNSFPLRDPWGATGG